MRYAKGRNSLISATWSLVEAPPPFPSSLFPSSYLSHTVIEDEEGVSKGYGFVRFMDEGERSQSYSELDGSIGLGRKAITIKPALAPKR